MARLEQLLERLVQRLERRYWSVTATCSAGMFVLILASTSFHLVLREDAFVYVLKGFEITGGNWIPVRSHSIGWSALIALFLALFKVQSLFAGMVLSRLLGSLLMAASLFPVAAIARRVGGPRTGLLAVLAVAFSPVLIRSGRMGLSEPLFILLVLSGIYCLLDHSLRLRRLFPAAALFSLAFAVRPNGIFLAGFLVLAIAPAIWTGRRRFFLLLACPLIFLLVSAPHLLGRYQAFGSPLDFGMNSTVYREEAPSRAAPGRPAGAAEDGSEGPSWARFGRYLEGFSLKGMSHAYQDFVGTIGSFWSLVFLLAFIQYALRERTSRLTLLFGFVFFFVLTLVPMYHAWQSRGRYLEMLVPLVFIVSARFLVAMLQSFRFRNVVLTIFLAALALPLIRIPARVWPSGFSLDLPRVQDRWALWAAAHLRGKIGIVEGGDLIAMNWADAEVYGRDQYEISSPAAGLSLFRPGSFKTMALALEDFQKRGVDYLMLDERSLKRRPYLREVYSSAWSHRFVPVASFRESRGGEWRIPDMTVFRVLLPARAKR